MKASIIIPTYNGAGRIRPCLQALQKQEAPFPFEILVVDDGSADDTAAVAGSFEGVTVITQPNAGPAAARNNGARKAAGEILVFTDDDCEPEPDWLVQMTAPFDDPQISGVKGAYRSRQTELTARFVQYEYEEKFARLERQRYIDFIDTFSAAFRKTVFEKTGGFDTAFTTASTEDQEFSFRLASMGEKMVFAPKAIVWHKHINTPAGYLKKKFKIGFWKTLTIAKNPDKAYGDSHTPFTLKLQTGLMGLFPLSLLELPVLGSSVLPDLIAAAFAVSALPLTLRCFKADPAVGLAAPFFILLRALGLAAGLARGFAGRLSAPATP